MDIVTIFDVRHMFPFTCIVQNIIFFFFFLSCIIHNIQLVTFEQQLRAKTLINKKTF